MPTIHVVACGVWPKPSTLIGIAEGPDAWDIAAEARRILDETGHAPADLPGFTLHIEGGAADAQPVAA